MIANHLIYRSYRCISDCKHLIISHNLTCERTEDLQTIADLMTAQSELESKIKGLNPITALFVYPLVMRSLNVLERFVNAYHDKQIEVVNKNEAGEATSQHFHILTSRTQEVKQ